MKLISGASLGCSILYLICPVRYDTKWATSHYKPIFHGNLCYPNFMIKELRRIEGTGSDKLTMEKFWSHILRKVLLW
jgi:hypothetical protein